MTIIDKVAHCLVTAGSTFREDQKEAYRKAIAQEPGTSSCWVMQQVLDNALVAEKNQGPLCDDTGIPHLFLEVGPNRQVTGKLIEQIHAGTEKGLRELPGRPMAIMGDDMHRIDQSGGLDPDPGALAPSPMIIKSVKDDVLRLTILMLGGGPAIRGITQRVFHKHSVDAGMGDHLAQKADHVRLIPFRRLFDRLIIHCHFPSYSFLTLYNTGFRITIHPSKILQPPASE